MSYNNRMLRVGCAGSGFTISTSTAVISSRPLERNRTRLKSEPCAVIQFPVSVTTTTIMVTTLVCSRVLSKGIES